KLVQIVPGLFLYRSGKLLLLLSIISLSTSQPACDNMVNCPVAIAGRNVIECFSCQVEIAEAQRGRNQIELTIRILGKQVCDSTTPRDRLFEILFLCCVG